VQIAVASVAGSDPARIGRDLVSSGQDHEVVDSGDRSTVCDADCPAVAACQPLPRRTC
jgi:hypothetical protein